MDATQMAGRPRDEAVGPALKQAARRLVIDLGYDKVSVSAILSEAGVSRQTLYRRWPTKADLVLDAFMEVAGDVSVAEGLTLAPALRAFLGVTFQHLNAEGGAMRSLIGTAQSDPAFRKKFYDDFVSPRNRLIVDILNDAVARGELTAQTDTETLGIMVHGAFWYRLLNDQPLDDAFLERLVAMVMARA